MFRLYVIAFLLFIGNQAFAQQTGAVETVADTTLPALLMKMEENSIYFNKANASLKRGFDTAEMAALLPKQRQMIRLMKENLSRKGNDNLRNLSASQVILIELKKQLDRSQQQLSAYSKQLAAQKAEISKRLNDESLRIFEASPAVERLYRNQYREISNKGKTVLKLNHTATQKIGLLHNTIAAAYFDVIDLLDETDMRIRHYQKNIFLQDEPVLWKAITAKRKDNFVDVVVRSVQNSWLIFIYYLRFNLSTFLLALLVGILFYGWIRYNLFRIHKQNAAHLLTPVVYAHHPLTSGLLLTVCIAPFVYTVPPAVLVEALWLVMLGLITYLIYQQWPRKFVRYWLVFALLFIVAGTDSLLIASTLTERWLLMVVNAVAIYCGYYMIRMVKKAPHLYPVFLDEVLMLHTAMNAIAIICNLAGVFTLAKLLTNTAVVAVALAVAFYIMVMLILEAIYLQMETTSIRSLSGLIDYNDVKAKFRNILIGIAAILWLLAVAWSMNYGTLLLEKIIELLHHKIALGEFEFTLAGMLIFIGLIWATLLVARMLTFFFGTTESAFVAGKKNKVGSWVLLVRLGVIVGGFLIAIAAAGIPMDKLAIVLGALSVGIGFGLQNVVNNLVSGIILAFEKPMQVGDVIELGTRVGVVQEIGIRSSKIRTPDGAEIIVPNGDFISQQLINWTLSNTHRRIEMMVGVAYGTDIGKVKMLLKNYLTENEKILQSPPPLVLVNEFANSAVNIRILFWTADFDNWILLRDEVMHQVYLLFKENGIQIPFPQQDIYIKEMPGKQ